MIQSMTGFGKASAEIDGRKVTVVLKTLNSKQLDVSVRLSPRYRSRELDLRALLSRHLIRGKIEMSILNEEGPAEQRVADVFSLEMMAAYAERINELSSSLHISPPDDMMKLLIGLPGVYRATEEERFVDVSPQEWEALSDIVESAIRSVVDFRCQEGHMLQGIFQENIRKIGDYLDRVEAYEGDRLVQIKQRIEHTLEKLGADNYDKGRLEQEMIYYIEKLDVSEEKNRLRNHLNYFLDTMNGAPAQGKKLGFITQEIGREINTLGAKSNLVEMQQLVVSMKDELEQIKEQVLNTL